MPYPQSPFREDFDAKLLLKLGNDDDSTVNEIQNRLLLEILEWLCKAPKITSYRINTLKCDVAQAQEYIQTYAHKNLGKDVIRIDRHPQLDEVLIVQYCENKKTSTLEKHDKEVIVDTICAAAVLRGAHIFAPGVLAMMSGTQINETVSIYADITRKCKRGLQKRFDQPKILIANGIVKMNRNQLFTDNPADLNGIAIEITETSSNCPPIGDGFLPIGLTLLQNLPSIVCVRVLDPQPHETILDMCAAPGNKTTHIAALMNNQGLIVAVDKTPAKVAQLERRCREFNAKVHIIQADSTKLFESGKLQPAPEKFHRILLDAPCSALGQRPQFLNTITPKVLRSYVPVQRKLFTKAVELLRDDGILVYSTCTVTLAENEGIVAWALKTFQNLQLIPALPHFAGAGLEGTALTGAELGKVQRFGPAQEIDSVGFFIAKFIKRKC